MNNEFFKGFQPGGGLRILQWFGLPNTYFRVLNRSFFRACNHFHFLNNVSSGNLNPKDKECFFSEIRSFDRGGTLKTSIGEYSNSPPQARKISGGSTKGLIPYPPGVGGGSRILAANTWFRKILTAGALWFRGMLSDRFGYFW